MRRVAWWVALAGLALSASGCLGPRVAVEPPREEGEERSITLHRLAEKEAELQHWRDTAEQLRISLDEARKQSQGFERELYLSRTALERAVAERDGAILAQAAADRTRREVLERLAERELELLRAERESLEAELARRTGALAAADVDR